MRITYRIYGRVLQGVGLRPLSCWNRVFEVRGEYVCSFHVFVVCRVGSGHCDKLITRAEESYLVCVSDCV